MALLKDLVQILEAGGGHEGLLTLLQNVDQSEIKFEEGEPKKPLIYGVKTYVAFAPYYDNSITLFFYPVWSEIDFLKIAAEYLVGGFKRADESVLKAIGMASDRCHPFPNLEHIKNNIIDLLFIDSKMADETIPYNFPIYSTVSPQRIGSIYVPPKLYFEAIYKLIGDRIRKISMLSELDIAEFGWR